MLLAAALAFWQPWAGEASPFAEVERLAAQRRFADAIRVAYNAEQSQIAIGNGGLTGQGLFNGSQTSSNLVPEQQTDFIFSVAGEELGFVGAASLLALFAVIGAAHGPQRTGAAVYAALVAFAGLVGGGIAARQVWLQHLPESQVPACGPGLEYMLEMYPLGEVLTRALRGTGECAAVDWTFLGGSIAEWSLLCFTLIVVAHCGYVALELKQDAASARG